MEHQTQENQSPATPTGIADDQNIAVIMWIATLFLGFIPSLIVYLLYTDKPFIRQHSIAGLNFSITSILVLIIVYVMSLFLIGFLFFPFLFIWVLYVCIKGAIVASRQQTFNPPLTFKFLK